MTSLVLPVEFISANDLVTVLKPMVSAAGSVTAVPRSNTIIITDTAPSVKNHLELIRLLDVDAFERFDVSIMPLKNVDVKTMHRELTEVLGALGMGFGSRTLAERAAATPQFFTMLAAASGGRMVTNPGGVLIKDGGGDIIGAVGISGDTADKDEACAIAGIEATGLKADPGGTKS